MCVQSQRDDLFNIRNKQKRDKDETIAHKRCDELICIEKCEKYLNVFEIRKVLSTFCQKILANRCFFDRFNSKCEKERNALVFSMNKKNIKSF